MRRVLELEVPEENLVLFQSQLSERLAQQVTSRQEEDHYPLLKVVLTSPEMEWHFIQFLREKLDSGELDRDFVILGVESEDDS